MVQWTQLLSDLKQAAAQEMECVKVEVGIHLHLVASRESKVIHFN